MNAHTSPRTLLQQMFAAAVEAAQPVHCIPKFLPEQPKGRLIVIGAGKASAAMAKASLGDVYSRTARRSVEIHGGIGFTWEFDLQLWYKRAHANEIAYGDPSFHRERVAVLDGY